MSTYTLYLTSHCHLCEHALLLIYSAIPEICLQQVDIADNDELLLSYGLRIPVLRQDNTDKELNWPFTQDDLLMLCVK